MGKFSSHLLHSYKKLTGIYIDPYFESGFFYKFLNGSFWASIRIRI